MSHTILKLTSMHGSLAEELIQTWNEDEGISNPKIPDVQYLKKLLAKEDFHCYVALVADEVVGGLTAYELPMFDEETTEMFLYEIGVASAHRKLGIAKDLIQSLKNTCRQKQISVIFVATDASNHIAKKLYQNTGGQPETVTMFTYEQK